MSKNRGKGSDVYWYIPRRKRPIMGSTRFASDLLAELAKDGCTYEELREKVYYDLEAQSILDEYISRGWGKRIARDYIKPK